MPWPPTVHQDVQDAVATGQFAGGSYFRPGHYHGGLHVDSWGTTNLGNTGMIMLVPFLVPARQAFDRIGINVTTAAGTGGVIHMAVYKVEAGVPKTLVVDAGTISGTVTGAREIPFASVLTLDPFMYALAIAATVAGATVSSWNQQMNPWVGGTTEPPAPTTGNRNAWFGNLVSGAFPASLTGVNVLNGSAPTVVLRAA